MSTSDLLPCNLNPLLFVFLNRFARCFLNTFFSVLVYCNLLLAKSPSSWKYIPWSNYSLWHHLHASCLLPVFFSLFLDQEGVKKISPVSSAWSSWCFTVPYGNFVAVSFVPIWISEEGYWLVDIKYFGNLMYVCIFFYTPSSLKDSTGLRIL